MECLPGDEFNINSSSLVRFQPIIAPFMHRVTVYCHYFFVPNRIIWDGFEEFITGGVNGDAAPVHPFISYNPATTPLSSLYDYLGLPVSGDTVPTGQKSEQSASTINVNALPFAVYESIYNEYYRDQNLQPELTGSKLVNGNNTNTSSWELQNRNWQHDYFTSALPWSQRGEEVTIGLGSTAPLIMQFDDVYNTRVVDGSGQDVAWNADARLRTGIVSGETTLTNAGNSAIANLDITEYTVADLSEAGAVTITELRKAIQMQEYLEKNARGGSRYIENIKMHFGVNSSDARLQRPEFLGGYQTPLKVSEVLQTAASPTDPDAAGYITPQGTMGGHGISVGSGKPKGYRVEEHGWIMGIFSVMPRTAYQQGIHKSMLRFTKEDYYWPSFAHIGEQAIEQREVAVSVFEDGGNYNYYLSDQTKTFGYIPRYSEYKFMNSSVHGDFKETLDFWHIGRIFETEPALNADFMDCDSNEADRIFAVQTEGDRLWCHILNEVEVTRKMPIFGTPRIG